MRNLVWIFKNKFNAQRRKDALIDRFCKVINEHEDGPPICRYDQFIEEEFQCKSEEEIQDLVEEAEEYYRKPLQIVKRKLMLLRILRYGGVVLNSERGIRLH